MASKTRKKLGKLYLFSVKGAQKVVLNRVGVGVLLQCNTPAGKTSSVNKIPTLSSQK